MSIAEFYKCTNRELFIFIAARSEALKEERIHSWDIARHMMWASIQPHVEKKMKPSDLIRIETDTITPDLSGYEKQEIDRWSEKCDEGMPLVDWDGNPIN